MHVCYPQTPQFALTVHHHRPPSLCSRRTWTCHTWQRERPVKFSEAGGRELDPLRYSPPAYHIASSFLSVPPHGISSFNLFALISNLGVNMIPMVNYTPIIGSYRPLLMRSIKYDPLSESNISENCENEIFSVTQTFFSLTRASDTSTEISSLKRSCFTNTTRQIFSYRREHPRTFGYLRVVSWILSPPTSLPVYANKASACHALCDVLYTSYLTRLSSTVKRNNRETTLTKCRSPADKSFISPRMRVWVYDTKEHTGARKNVAGSNAHESADRCGRASIIDERARR